MNRVAPNHLPMTPKRVVRCLLLLMMGAGLVEGDQVLRSAFTNIDAFVSLAGGYVCLLWYRDDSEARSIPRSRLLSVAMVGLPLIAIPGYLLHSRPVIERGSALMSYLGCVVLMPVATWVGAVVHRTMVLAAS